MLHFQKLRCFKENSMECTHFYSQRIRHTVSEITEKIVTSICDTYEIFSYFFSYQQSKSSESGSKHKKREREKDNSMKYGYWVCYTCVISFFCRVSFHLIHLSFVPEHDGREPVCLYHCLSVLVLLRPTVKYAMMGITFIA